MKKFKKLTVKKVTLRDLDEPMLQGMAGAATTPRTCVTCESCVTCHQGATCCEDKCICTGNICNEVVR